MQTEYGKQVELRELRAHMRKWEKDAPKRWAAMKARQVHYMELEDRALAVKLARDVARGIGDVVK